MGHLHGILMTSAVRSTMASSMLHQGTFSCAHLTTNVAHKLGLAKFDAMRQFVSGKTLLILQKHQTNVTL
jgi:hypothetical protein